MLAPNREEQTMRVTRQALSASCSCYANADKTKLCPPCENKRASKACGMWEPPYFLGEPQIKEIA